MLTVEQVANYFLLRSSERLGDAMTNLRLQKLVYYAQAWHLVAVGEPLFQDDFQGWIHGPVIPHLYRAYSSFGWQPIPRSEGIVINVADARACDMLDRVWDFYGRYTAKELRDLTHGEAPWQDARRGYKSHEHCNVVITKDSMRNYYSTRDAAAYSSLLAPVGSARGPQSMQSMHDGRGRDQSAVRSEGYRAHLEAARLFLDAAEGSDEKALAGVELSARLARDLGQHYQAQGGDIRAVLARLRQQQGRVPEPEDR